METGHAVVDLKRKCSTRRGDFSIHKHLKRRKQDGSKIDSGHCLLKYYDNFKKSGLPNRVLSYQNDEWTDFPQEFVSLVKKDHHMKKAATEVEFNGRSILLDFVHMLQLDLETGVQLPMAWIDEAGNCFFPETFSHQEHANNCDALVSEPHGANDIKLHLAIKIDSSDGCKFEDSHGESTALKKIDEAVGENQQVEENDGNLGSDTVREMFFMGALSPSNANIVKIYRGSSTAILGRFELFQKQVEIVNKYRGVANVRYAWLPSSKGAVASIMAYGLGSFSQPKLKAVYGDGVHLTPVNCTEISAKYCDDDENGVRYMVLCRVIMGNMELVSCGSKQFLPSSEDFDSGVDDLQNPKHYVVWNMNMNTHICPEYVVSFKISSYAEGFLFGDARQHDISGFTNQGAMGDEANADGSRFTGSPKSPWLPMPMLLAGISDKVSPKEMALLKFNLDLFRKKKMSRGDFVKQIRLMVGDTLLISTITNLQSMVPPERRVMKWMPPESLKLKLENAGSN